MFAPDGFIPVSQAIGALEPEKVICRGWFTEIVQLSAGQPSDWDENFFKWRASRARELSLRELEQRGIERALNCESLYACHPDKGVWIFDFPVFMRLVGYRHMFRNEDVRNEYFDAALDWPHYESQISEIEGRHEDPWGELFLDAPETSPSLFVNTTTGVLDYSELRLCSRYFLIEYTLRSEGYPFEFSDIQPFEGWALCLSEKAFSQGRFNERYRKGAAEIVCRAALGDDFVDDLMRESPEKWHEFIGLETRGVNEQTKGTIGEENRAYRYFEKYLETNGTDLTKQELKRIYPHSLGQRAFERVWGRLRELYPELSKPGRRPIS